MIVNISTCLHLKVRSAALRFSATPEQPLAALVNIQDPLFLLRDLESSLSFCPRPYQTRRAFFERYREQFHSVDGFVCSVSHDPPIHPRWHDDSTFLVASDPIAVRLEQSGGLFRAHAWLLALSQHA